MDWEIELISLYLFVCKHYQNNLAMHCQRMSHYSDLKFSAEEAITLYVYGVMSGYRTLKSIHLYAQKHLLNWFPHLPKYVAFDQRINKLHDIFVPLVDLLSKQLTNSLDIASLTGLTDSMPIIMAQRGRRFNAKVAPAIATKNGYCATKKLYYYGVKLHVIAIRQVGTLPVPALIGLTNAGMNDRKAFEQITPFLPSHMLDCYADKAYQVENEPIYQKHNLILFTPVKKAKGEKFLDAAQQWLSTAIAQVRQPIESFFNWVNERTGIQIASKVRSYQGLMVHVFGRLAAALFVMRNKMIPNEY